MGILPNPYVILGIAGAWLVSLVAASWLMYARGHDDMRNAYTEQQLTQANQNLAASQRNQNRSQKAGETHDENVRVVHDTTREIVRTITIPPDRDPLLPVWFVRLLDRAAGRTVNGDPYPGKSDRDASDVTLSEAGALLAGVGGWSDLYYTCRKQVEDTSQLKPVLPAPAKPERGLLDRLNPF